MKAVRHSKLIVFLFLIGGLYTIIQVVFFSKEGDPVLHPAILKFYNYSNDGLNGDSVSMDDPRLIKKLRTSLFLLPPPPYSHNHHYQLSQPELKDPSMGQGEKIRQILKNKTNGFFVECGALDGEIRSNTLYFERYLNWTGLLIEADPLNFQDLLTKNRRAWLSPTCLSTSPYPKIVSFEQNRNMGKISEDVEAGSKLPKHVDVQCYPLYSYLLALNVTTIDYFSLDVEGAELEVLKHIPFDKIDIKTLSVEYAHVPEGKEGLEYFMVSKGYTINSEVTHPDWLANDFIFTKV